MEFITSEASIGSADWDWTMDEFALIPRPSLANISPPSSPKSKSKKKIVSQSFYSNDLSDIIFSHNYYLHYLIYYCQIGAISQLLHLPPKNLKEIMSALDHHGNSPLFLAVKLCRVSREYLSIVRLLIEHGANASEKDVNGWSLMNEAVSQKNRELVSVLFNYIYIEKLGTWENNRNTAKEFLKRLKNFYVEIRWEFNSNVIPLVSKIGPHDTCKLWKHKGKLRFDSTLVGWKNFRSKRRNISVVFDEELLIVNHSKKIVVNPLEELDAEERNEIINDIMNSEPVQGDFSLLGHSINSVHNWKGAHSFKNFGNWKGYKYKIQFRTHLSVVKKFSDKKIEKDYFANVVGKMPKPYFEEKKISERETPKKNFRTKSMTEPVTSNLKNSTIYCWICDDFPITIKELLTVLQVIKNANKSLDRLYEFLENEGIATMLPENSFPVQLEIPISLAIRAKATFLNFTVLGNEFDEEKIFQVPCYEKVSRKIGQKTLTSPNKRLFFTNMVS